MRIFNFQFTIFKLLFLVVFLIVIPLSCKGFFLDDWFEDWFEQDEFDLTSTNSVQIINEVRVEANTGGNKADEGEVIEGGGEVKVEIKTIINNEEIEPVNIETEANKVRVESEIKVENNEASVKREIEISPDNSCDTCGGIETEDRGVIEEKLEVVKNWWLDFIESLKSIILGIFNI